MDVRQSVTSALENFLNNSEEVAERIMDVARMAGAYEMLLKAQEIQSSVEAENSTHVGLEMGQPVEGLLLAGPTLGESKRAAP